MAKDPSERNCIRKMVLSFNENIHLFFLMEENVITLNFGSRPRQGLQGARAKRSVREC